MKTALVTFLWKNPPWDLIWRWGGPGPLTVGGSFPAIAISGLEGLQEALGGGFLWAYF